MEDQHIKSEDRMVRFIIAFFVIVALLWGPVLVALAMAEPVRLTDNVTIARHKNKNNVKITNIPNLKTLESEVDGAFNVKQANIIKGLARVVYVCGE